MYQKVPLCYQSNTTEKIKLMTKPADFSSINDSIIIDEGDYSVILVQQSMLNVTTNI